MNKVAGVGIKDINIITEKKLKNRRLRLKRS